MKEKDVLALMGKIITVSNVLQKQYTTEREHKWVVKKITPRAGWVVGYRFKQNGTVIPACSYDDQNWLKIESTVPTLQVVFWPNMNPVTIPFDCSAYILGGIPKPNRCKWTEKDMATLSSVFNKYIEYDIF